MKFCKRFIIRVSILCLSLSFFAACKNSIDSSKWIDNFDDGRSAAQKEDKKILVLFSNFDKNPESKVLKDGLLSSEEFLSAFTKEYVLVNLDFSKSLLEKAYPVEGMSESEEKAALALAEKIEDNIKAAYTYDVADYPSIYVLSKEGYVLAMLGQEVPDEFGEATSAILNSKEIKSMEDLTNLFLQKDKEIKEMEALIADVKNKSGPEKARAIHALYEATGLKKRYALHDLGMQMKNLDPKNESGFVPQALMAVANADAMDLVYSQKIEEAANVFNDVASSEFLSVEEKQACYYQAAAILMNSESSNFPLILRYYELCSKMDPESDMGKAAKAAIEQISKFLGMFQNSSKENSIDFEEVK